jgi:NAD(P)-dependent dehydrogenase (short-subunit alcohol dehydrogenase family)
VDLGLKEKVVIVVGATQGMGRGAARAIAQEGAHVVPVGRGLNRSEGAYDYVDKPSVEDVAAELRELGAASALPVTADFVEEAQVKSGVAKVLEKYGRIDGLVNTVGICEITESVFAADDAMWERSYQSVLMTAVRACREVSPLMRNQRSGAIVNTSAMSNRHFIPGLAHYSAMKAAIAHYTKNLAKEIGKDRVRANAILPGLLINEQHVARNKKEMAEKGMNEEEYWEWRNKYWATTSWSYRFGVPEDFGNLAAFLISDKSTYINGAWVNIDGGST